MTAPDLGFSDQSGTHEKADETIDDTEFGFDRLNPGVGWMLVGIGVLGFILPGVVGTPFFLLGGAVLVPGGKQRISRWASKKPRPIFRQSLKVVGRFMDDLERRYPTGP